MDDLDRLIRARPTIRVRVRVRVRDLLIRALPASYHALLSSWLVSPP